MALQQSTIRLNFDMMSVIVLSVVMLSAIKLSGFMFSIVILSVLTPKIEIVRDNMDDSGGITSSGN
jgi:hypothetical protein